MNIEYHLTLNTIYFSVVPLFHVKKFWDEGGQTNHMAQVQTWGCTTQNMIFSVWLDLVFYHPTMLNTNFQLFDN